MASQALFPVSVTLGSTTVGLVAWPSLTVRGLAQRVASAVGGAEDPEALVFELERVTLPATSTLATCLARWHRPASGDSKETVRLKCVRSSSSRASGSRASRPGVQAGGGGSAGGAKCRGRGSPRHTVRQVALRAAAALALPPGPARLAAEAEAAADVCLLPYTFTSWTDALELGLMPVAVGLACSLLPDKPSATERVMQALSELLDLPMDFAPRGPLYGALCALQLHTCLLAAAMPAQDAAAAAAAAAVAGSAGAAAERGGGVAGAAGPPEGGGGGGGGGCGVASGGAGGGVVARRGRRGAPLGGFRARCGRQREAALAAQARLLDKAAARAAAVLQQLSVFDSPLSVMLAEYKPPPQAAAAGAAGGAAAVPAQAVPLGQGPQHGAAAPSAAAGGPAAAAAPSRDLRLVAAAVLEPYAAMQLLDTLGRLLDLGSSAAIAAAAAGAVAAGAIAAGAGTGTGPAASMPARPVTATGGCGVLPAGLLPSGWECHRSLFQTVLDLGVAARGGGPLDDEGGIGGGAGGATSDDSDDEDGGSGYGGTGSGEEGAGANTRLGSGTRVKLELPLVARTLDVLLQLHVQAHTACGSEPAAGADGSSGGASVNTGANVSGSGGEAAAATIATVAGAASVDAAAGGAASAAGVPGGDGGRLGQHAPDSHASPDGHHQAHHAQGGDSGSVDGDSSSSSSNSDDHLHDDGDNDSDGDGDDSDDSSEDSDSSGSSSAASGSSGSREERRRRRRRCPRARAFAELPPCLDWLRDVGCVLEACCDVYSLAGGSSGEEEEEEEEEEEAQEVVQEPRVAVEVAVAVAVAAGQGPAAAATAASAPDDTGTVSALAEVPAQDATGMVTPPASPPRAAAAPAAPASPATPVPALPASAAGSAASTPGLASLATSPESAVSFFSNLSSASPALRVSPGSSPSTFGPHSFGGGAGNGTGAGSSSNSSAAAADSGHASPTRSGGSTTGAVARQPVGTDGVTAAAPAALLGSGRAAAPPMTAPSLAVAAAAAAASMQVRGGNPAAAVAAAAALYAVTAMALSSAPQPRLPPLQLAAASPVEPASAAPAVAAAAAQAPAPASAVPAAAAAAAAAGRTPPPQLQQQQQQQRVAWAPAAPLQTGPVPVSTRTAIVSALRRAFACPCIVNQLLAEVKRGGSRSGRGRSGGGSGGSGRGGRSLAALCERSVWRHPRLADCAPAAAYQKQVLDNLLAPLSYVYEDDDYDAPVLQVSRSDLLGTSVSELMQYDGYCLGSEGICISFDDEQAYGDGVLREWLTEVAGAVFDPNAGLFRLCEGDHRCLHLSAAGCLSQGQDDHLELLTFAGRVLGLAMRARVPLGFHLCTALFKLLQHPGRPGATRARLSLADLAQIDPRVAATCGQIAAAPDVEVLGLTFVASTGALGLAHEVPLLPGGEELAVTAANRRDYLQRLVRFYCTWGCSSAHGAALLGGEGGGGADSNSNSSGGAGAGAGAAGAAADSSGDGAAASGSSSSSSSSTSGSTARSSSSGSDGGAGAGRGAGGSGGGGSGGGWWEEVELDALEAFAQGLSEALLGCDEDGVGALAERLRAVAPAAFNGRLGGDTGGLDVAAWRAATSATAFKSEREKAALEAFWAVVAELCPEQRRRLLHFWTAVSHLPAGGFRHLSQQLQLVPARSGDDVYGSGLPDAEEGEAAEGEAAQGGAQQGQQERGREGQPPREQEDREGQGEGEGEGEVQGVDSGIVAGGPVGEQSAASLSGSIDGASPGGAAAAAAAVTGSSSASGSSSSGGGGGGIAGGDRRESGAGAGPSAAAAGGAAAEEVALALGLAEPAPGASEAAGDDDDANEPHASTPAAANAADAASASTSAGAATAAPAPAPAASRRPPRGSPLLSAHTCFFQLRLPLLGEVAAMREAVEESLANGAAFWNE